MESNPNPQNTGKKGKKGKKNKNEEMKQSELEASTQQTKPLISEISETPASKDDKKSKPDQNQIQEIPNPPLISQTSSGASEPFSQVQQLADTLKNLKLTSEEREKVMELSRQGDNPETHEQIKQLLTEMTASEGKRNRQDERKLKKIATLYDTHNFWDTQPVPKASDTVSADDLDKPIDVIKTVDEIEEDPLTIPAGFQWCNVNIENDEECKDVYDLLTQNYVEDDDAMFRFDYSIKFLQWALTPPGYKKDWLFGVRGGKKNKLFGFISGIPVHVNVNGKKVLMAEINFLCVHRTLRTKKLAPVLIKEVTRRVNRYNIWQAIYTAGIVIPTPITQTTYWHRSLNPKKLIEVGFSVLPPKTPLARYVKMNKVADAPKIEGLRPMEADDVGSVHKLLNSYLEQYKLNIQFTKEEIGHFLLPREWVIESFVVEDKDSKEITDFVSFYSLPSTILRHETHKILNVAYSYYNVPNVHSMTDLMADALVIAKQKGYDVFNALDVHQNQEFFKELKFMVGDGNLNYYLYNWRIEKINPADVGIVLV